VIVRPLSFGSSKSSVTIPSPGVATTSTGGSAGANGASTNGSPSGPGPTAFTARTCASVYVTPFVRPSTTNGTASEGDGVRQASLGETRTS